MTHGREAERPWARCQGGSAIRVSREGWKGTANEKGNVRRFEEGYKGAADRRRVVRCANVDGGRGCALDGRRRLDQDFGIIRACGSDVWRLCSDVLPDVGRVKACVQDKMGQLSKGCLDKLLDAMAGQSFKVCKNQTYALCAAARCNVYDGVAYCQCDVKHGDSISLPFPMGKGEDVCSINAAGADNKYMISTYSLPESIASPQGGGAIYTCSGEGSGAYAQCDGGICFRSTEETTFPGFDKPVPKGQIICSCPITQAKPATTRKAIKSWDPILATSPSSGTAKPPPPPATRVRRSMSVLRLARLRLWRSCSTARSRPSTSVGSSPIRSFCIRSGK